MKKGINSEYDKLRKELFEIKYKLELLKRSNVDKSDLENKVKYCVQRMTEIEVDYSRKKER